MTKKLKPIGWAIAETRKQIEIGSVVKKISGEFGLFEPLPKRETVDEPKPESTLANRIQNRTNDLAEIIKLAKKNAVNPNDTSSVWAAMVALAELPKAQRHYPLIGVEAGEIRYQASTGVIKFFDREALYKRMKRAR